MFPEASCVAGRQIQEHLKHSSEVQAQRQTSYGTERHPPPHPPDPPTPQPLVYI